MELEAYCQASHGAYVTSLLLAYLQFGPCSLPTLSLDHQPRSYFGPCETLNQKKVMYVANDSEECYLTERRNTLEFKRPTPLVELRATLPCCILFPSDHAIKQPPLHSLCSFRASLLHTFSIEENPVRTWIQQVPSGTSLISSMSDSQRGRKGHQTSSFSLDTITVCFNSDNRCRIIFSNLIAL